MIADRIEGKWIDLFAEVFRALQGRVWATPARCFPEIAVARPRTFTSLNLRCCALARARSTSSVPTARQSAPGADPLHRRLGRAAGIGAARSAALAASVFVADCTRRRPDARGRAAADPRRAGRACCTSRTSIPDVLRAPGPLPRRRAAGEGGMRLMREAKAMKVTSPAGTEARHPHRGRARRAASGATRRSRARCRTGRAACAWAFRRPAA